MNEYKTAAFYISGTLSYPKQSSYILDFYILRSPFLGLALSNFFFVTIYLVQYLLKSSICCRYHYLRISRLLLFYYRETLKDTLKFSWAGASFSMIKLLKSKQLQFALLEIYSTPKD